MTNLSPEICLKLKAARRAAKLPQSVVAAEVGCQQSALSMFEQGDGTKLNEEVISKLAKKFGVSLAPVEKTPTVSVRVPTLSREKGFCPNPHCPSNQVYEVEGRRLIRPTRAAADPVGGKFCACCGELLERTCPTCGAPVHEGAICSFCGDPYVALA